MQNVKGQDKKGTLNPLLMAHFPTWHPCQGHMWTHDERTLVKCILENLTRDFSRWISIVITLKKTHTHILKSSVSKIKVLFSGISSKWWRFHYLINETKHSSLPVSLQHVSHSLQLIMGKSVQNFAHLTFLHIRRKKKINKDSTLPPSLRYNGLPPSPLVMAVCIKT